jgi:hypothetical protein
MLPAAPSATARDPRTRPERALARRLLTLVTPLALLAGLTACSDDGPTPTDLPDAAAVLTDAAAAFADVTSLHVVVDIDPPLGTLVPIARVDIDLTAEGATSGKAQIVIGSLITADMISTTDGRSFLDIGTGWFETDMVASAYDTTAILDPDRGIAKLLATATGAQTVGSEKVGDTDAWKITCTLSSDVVESLVPADLPDGALTGELWIARDTNLLVKAIVSVPATSVSDPATIDMTITNYNVPVTISAPI